MKRRDEWGPADEYANIVMNINAVVGIGIIVLFVVWIVFG